MEHQKERLPQTHLGIKFCDYIYTPIFLNMGEPHLRHKPYLNLQKE